MKHLKLLFSILFAGSTNLLAAQTGKAGVDTNTPTENLDVKGTLRIRSLPNTGVANSIYTTGTDTHSRTSPTQTFTAATPLLMNNDGVVGRTTFSDVVPNNTTPSGFNSLDASTSMMVIKRFTIGDWASGQGGNLGFDTGMSVSSWEAIISGWMTTLVTDVNNIPVSSIFRTEYQFGFRLRAQGASSGTWRILGDISFFNETQFVDVLFIKKKYVAADVRTN
ncbi:hypothetical protein SAMN05421594_4081 [Chryseobacterium oleae]|uniref:Uncharacterized protein n=1 Tax=Chryseobacterium oleae TaxID=491207 RepID=A0A1I5BIN4_CHROL|nr:hypothetical protein [Chryseobacterium oleae]SFN74439.1 hypothetical protein SAMN05421594_4081 [Chryseobacterium oleae]